VRDKSSRLRSRVQLAGMLLPVTLIWLEGLLQVSLPTCSRLGLFKRLNSQDSPSIALAGDHLRLPSQIRLLVLERLFSIWGQLPPVSRCWLLCRRPGLQNRQHPVAFHSENSGFIHSGPGQIKRRCTQKEPRLGLGQPGFRLSLSNTLI